MPVGLANVCSGKEGEPTLAYQATVNHKMRFMSDTKSFYGSTNDKAICKSDHLWEADIDWRGPAGNHDDGEDGWPVLNNMNIITQRAMHRLTDGARIGYKY
jgi:hypothetical protein